VVVLPEASLTVALRLAQEVVDVVVAEPLVSQPLVQASVSIGVAQALPDRSIAETLRAADEALYAAKRDGRCRVVGERRLTEMATATTTATATDQAVAPAIDPPRSAAQATPREPTFSA
jgi:predicted signal transduction protein with EAL and GGDEF domain